MKYAPWLIVAIVVVGGIWYFSTSNKTEATVITVDGSSTVFPITEAVAEEYQKENAGVKVTVGLSGTGGGFKKFCAGEIDISDASRPIKPSEVDLCTQNAIGYIEVPIAYDGLAIVVNPKNTWMTSITVAELKKLWAPEAQSTITKWNQIRAEWPEEDIHLYGAGVDSGTYDYFTEAIVGVEHSSRGDFTSSEDDNVLVQGVAGDEFALGFFGLAYYENNQDQLRLVPVDDERDETGKGPIAASVETVADGTYQPLSRPLFIYVNPSALDRAEVAGFVDFYLGNAPTLVAEVGYIPLSSTVYELGKSRIAERKTGSVFGGGGSQVGVKLDELLQKEQDN